MYIYIYVFVHICVYICMYMYTCMYVFVHICVYIFCILRFSLHSKPSLSLYYAPLLFLFAQLSTSGAIFPSAPVSLGCRIHWLYLCQGYDSPNKFPGYDTKQSDGEVPVMLELWEMRRTPSLPSLPGPLWPGGVAHDKVLSMGQIELNCIFMLNWIV